MWPGTSKLSFKFYRPLLQDITQTGKMHFVNNDLELAQMTLGQGHDIPSEHKQSLCEIRTSIVSP